jgi:hypothetical protein
VTSQSKKRAVLTFFSDSEHMEREVLRPLSHIRSSWELQPDDESNRYLDEEDSFAWLFNFLIDRLSVAQPPLRYHDNEDRLGEYVQKELKWNVRRKGKAWAHRDGSRLNLSEYLSLLEQGGYDASGIDDLIEAASGRVHAALRYGQRHFDDMEESHQIILAGVLANILYHLEPHEAGMRGDVGLGASAEDEES